MHCGIGKNQLFLGIVVLLVCLFWNTAFSAGPANYDTAWTYAYDGGVARGKDTIADAFRDVALLPNGDAVLVGETRDSSYFMSILVVKLSASGQALQSKVLRFNRGTVGAAILIDKNGDYLVGGRKVSAPFIFRLDADLGVKSEFWHYDSILDRDRLFQAATLQSMIHAQDGRIVATGGELYPSRQDNYAVWMEFDSQGVLKNFREWKDESGVRLSGWSIVENKRGEFLMGGQQAVAYMDSVGVEMGKRKYTFSLPGVGTETNNVNKVRRLRDGRILAVGQAYEEDCWTRYQRLSFDGWWSLLAASGQNLGWNTAGVSGTEDNIEDAVQLLGGRIAFVGNKGTSSDTGLWVFVTDTSGKTIEWQRQYNLPGTVSGSSRNDISAFAMVATPDSGFLIAGRENRPGQHDDAVVFKFVSRPVPTSANPKPGRNSLISKLEGRRVIVSSIRPGADVVLTLFDVQGVEVARYGQTGNQAGQCRFDTWQIPLKRGVYLWEIKTDRALGTGTLAVVDKW